LNPPGGIQVTVNGEPVSVPAGATVADVLQQLSLDRRRVAVEVNLLVLPRAEHEAHRLNDGDQLEIVTFVGGGAC
jgi:sulfur carrier protein